MRALLAFDKFKQALSARAACDVVATALAQSHPEWRLDLCPLTDGGDGFAQILTAHAGGTLHPITVTGPRGRPVQAAVGLVRWEKVPVTAQARLGLDHELRSESRIAVVELAAASGLALLSAEEQDPWQTSTVGTGELIRATQRLDCAAVVLGIGGSATNDLGLGALAALGLQFDAEAGQPLFPPIPADWSRIARIRGSVMAGIPTLRIACDVTNPLLGPRGCAATYGPQKGLVPADVPKMEHAGARMALMLCAHCEQPDALMDVAGAGAAGGVGFGLMVCAGAKLVQGSALVAGWLDLDQRIAAADLIITGEGCFDESSVSGKAPGTLIARATALGKPVYVFAGRISPNTRTAARLHAITPPELPLADALARTTESLRAAVRRQWP